MTRLASLPTLAEVQAQRRGTPKPARGTKNTERRHKKRTLDEIDREESRDVQRRSGGRCEVVSVSMNVRFRCPRRATSVHHMLSGRGVRGRQESALAIRKLHVCDGPGGCHALITEKRLVLVLAGRLPRFDDVYVRR